MMFEMFKIGIGLYVVIFIKMFTSTKYVILFKICYGIWLVNKRNLFFCYSPG